MIFAWWSDFLNINVIPADTFPAINFSVISFKLDFIECGMDLCIAHDLDNEIQS